MVVLGLGCCVGFSLVASSGGSSVRCLCFSVRRLLFVVEHRLQGAHAAAVAQHGLVVAASRLQRAQ